MAKTIVVRCERCGERLAEGSRELLELNASTAAYGVPGSVPPQLSQGLFPFGASCARRGLKDGGVIRRIRRAAR